MTTTYNRRDIAETCPGSGADFDHQLLTALGTSADTTVTVANLATEDSYATTPSGEPGSDGQTGDYTVEVQVNNGDNNIFASIALRRVNSSCVTQQTSAFSSEQQASGGLLTFNFSAEDLGTWAAGDRLVVIYRFRSAKEHGGDASIDIEANTVNAEVVAPWTLGAALEENVDEDVNLVEVVARMLSMTRPVDEDVQMQEQVNRLMGMTRNVDETVNLAETVAMVLGLTRNVDEQEQLVEVVAYLLGRMQEIGEIQELREVVVRSLSMTRAVNETVNIPETIARRMGLNREVGETVNVQETVTHLRGHLEFINEQEQIVEAVFNLLGQTQVIDEQETIVESVAFLLETVDDGTENQGLTDVGLFRSNIHCKVSEMKKSTSEPDTPPAGKIVTFVVEEGGKMVHKIKFPSGQVKTLASED